MSHSPSTPLDALVAMKTDIGRKRKQNQDAIGHAAPPDPGMAERLGQIFVLADGVGGLSGGDLASQYAVSTIISSYYDQADGEPPERLARAIAEANAMIFAEGQGQDRPAIMATTVVAAVLRGDELIIGSVGDSPAFLMRDADVRQLTLDHTAEVLQRDPASPAEGESHKLARALGSLPSVKVDIISGRVRPRDHVVLCSDGLTRYVSPREIEQTVATLSPERAVDTLIEIANDRGGADNVSVIVLRLEAAFDEAGTEIAAGLAPLAATAALRAADLPDEPPPLPPAPAPRREPLPDGLPPDDEPPAQSAWAVLLDIARGNALVTAATLTILLVAFVAIMLAVAGIGGGSSATPTVDPAALTGEASTAAAFLAATRQADSQATQVALEATDAAQLATIAVLTLTPPPNSGPQLETGMWFKVLSGEPIPAFEDAAIDADSATELEAGENYRVSAVDRDSINGFWYFVVDNLGQETRWVNGPSLHRRVVVVDDSGNPLPDDQQPPDIPPGLTTPTRAVPPTPAFTGTPGTPGPQQTGTPGEATPTLSPEPPTPVIGYGVEAWSDGAPVITRQELQLCETPVVATCAAGLARAGETGVIVDGPISSGEHWWWKVEFADGRAGWIAQVLLGPA